MITIFVTIEKGELIQQLINSEYRLNELVSVTTSSAELANIYVDEEIYLLPDWENIQPPILFEKIPFSNEALLGLIYMRLNNFERAYELLIHFPTLSASVDLMNRLQNEVEVYSVLPEPTNAIAAHNRAAALHYERMDATFKSEIVENYEIAYQTNKNFDQKQFSYYHLAQFHIDANQFNTAEQIIELLLKNNKNKKIVIACKDLQCKIWMKQLQIPYDVLLLEKLKTNLWECLEYYEANNRKTEAGLLLLDAGYIATISNSFSEALGYINNALTIFDSEQQEILSAQANYTKGNLLQTWAQNGNPQFYRGAAEAYLKALKIFTKKESPDVFAEIQHQLGKVYAEIPDEVKKKSVWAAVSISSFNEALSYFNKIDFPYEFAMICNSFGNAYTKYPAALHNDNFDKALAWYREALDVRTAEQYPIERTLTLANYLEASWFAGNKEAFDLNRYEDMMQVANELVQLSPDATIIENTKLEIERLEQLKTKLIKQQEIMN